MPNDDEIFSQFSLEDACSVASTEAPLSPEEAKIYDLGLIGLMMRYIYLGSGNYAQKTEDLHSIKTILLEHGDLLKMEASIEFITTQLDNQFATQPGFQFNQKVIMSSVKCLFNAKDPDDIEMALSLLCEDFRTISKPKPTQNTPISFSHPVVNDDSPNQCCLCPRLAKFLRLFFHNLTLKEKTFSI
jgi:hypothetical protein